MRDFSTIIDIIRKHYKSNSAIIPLHEPRFIGNEKKYLNECIDSTFVSSVGPFVDKFERQICNYTGAKHAIAVVNGTAALHLSLILAGVKRGDLVITQSLSFIATCNAISYNGAEPYFIDIDTKNLGMSADALQQFLEDVELKNGRPFHRKSGKHIGACVPMHTFGLPAEIDKIVEMCSTYQIPVVEDAAESLGSTWKGKHTGTFGLLGIYSFNGNKTITSGGGGIIITDDEELARLAKHLSTQAKVSHPWNFEHDAVGYNYRCPNINAALAVAQLEQLDLFIENKRQTAFYYQKELGEIGIPVLKETEGARSNYWLNAILLNDVEEKNQFLQQSNKNGVMTRPAWQLMNKLEMFKHCDHDELKNTIFIEERLVNIPSSVIL